MGDGFAPLGESHGKGTTTNGQTAQLLDQIGPVGRFGEKKAQVAMVLRTLNQEGHTN